MTILNHINFINYNTHVSFSHIGLEILTVFAWSIFLRITFKRYLFLANIGAALSLLEHVYYSSLSRLFRIIYN